MFKAWASKLFMAKGYTLYCGLVRGPQVEKLHYVMYIIA